jgi:hypothetical protein
MSERERRGTARSLQILPGEEEIYGRLSPETIDALAVES